MGAGVVGAQAALAEPAGCGHATNFWRHANGDLHTYGTYKCSSAETRTFRGEIKHDFSARPDSLVAANTTRGTVTSGVVTVHSCDNGNKATCY